MSGGWAGSERRAELDAEFQRAKPIVKRRDDGRCTWVDDGVRCASVGTDVDHIDDKHDHSLANLRLLCGDHHDRRTAQQGNAARWRVRAAREPEPHPGLT